MGGYQIIQAPDIDYRNYEKQLKDIVDQSEKDVKKLEELFKAKKSVWEQYKKSGNKDSLNNEAKTFIKKDIGDVIVSVLDKAKKFKDVVETAGNETDKNNEIIKNMTIQLKSWMGTYWGPLIDERIEEVKDEGTVEFGHAFSPQPILDDAKKFDEQAKALNKAATNITHLQKFVENFGDAFKKSGELIKKLLDIQKEVKNNYIKG